MFSSRNQKPGPNGFEQPAHIDGTSNSRPTTQDELEANERTRLLGGHVRPPRSDGYLDPDDPAVSPYNLWTVRLLHTVTVIFAAITFAWWVILLVSIFVTPPGMNARGSGYTDFAYTTLALGVLGVNLLFFSDPSVAMRVFLGIISFLLLVDVIIIASVQRIRFEESWVGIASAIWILLMGVWCFMTDRVVEWGKHEEEERLTGRPELRRTLKEWLSVLAGTVILAIYLIITILMTATLILRSIDAGLEPDGTRYEVNGGQYQVHLSCIGDPRNTSLGLEPSKVRPTVLFESGEDPIEGEFLYWAYGAYTNGTIGRYCYWDRPGYAWSDNAPSPHSAGMAADALVEVLAAAGETGPFISVSAGYGSIVARIFASRRPRDVKGLMFVDPLHEDLLGSRIGGASRGFRLWGWGVLSPLGIQRIAGALFSGRTKEDRVWGKSVRQTGRFLKALLQENLVAESLTRSEVMSARNVQPQRTPLAIISSGIESARDPEWRRAQEELSKYTKKLVGWDVVNDAPHRVWRSEEGQKVLEERLAQLTKEVMKRL